MITQLVFWIAFVITATGCAKEAVSAPSALPAAESAAPVAPVAPVAPAAPESPKSRAAKDAIAAYNVMRKALAADDLAATKAASSAASTKLAALKPVFAEQASAITAMVAGADRIATAGDIKIARTVFGEVSRGLIGLVASDPASQAGVVCYRCPMAKTYQKWLQVGDAMGNPYWGAEMLTCGGKVPIAP